MPGAKNAAPKAYPNPLKKPSPRTAMPKPPPLQFRALARNFHTTPQLFKARPRPAASVRNKAKQPWNLGSKPQGPGSDISIPTDILMSAQKSKLLPFGPAFAANLIRSYTPMLNMAPSEKVGNAICTGNLITVPQLQTRINPE